MCLVSSEIVRTMKKSVVERLSTRITAPALTLRKGVNPAWDLESARIPAGLRGISSKNARALRTLNPSLFPQVTCKDEQRYSRKSGAYTGHGTSGHPRSARSPSDLGAFQPEIGIDPSQQR